MENWNTPNRKSRKTIIKDWAQIIVGLLVIIVGLYIGYWGWHGLYVQTGIGAAIVWLIAACFLTCAAAFVVYVGWVIMADE